MTDQTEATPTEREAIVAWLRERADDRKHWIARLILRFRCAWITFRQPHAMCSAALHHAADAIERGDHLKGQTDGNPSD